MNIKTSELGFAAYLILQGIELESYKNGFFHFKTEKKESELRVGWVNSNFAKFDKILLDLKRFKN